MKSAVAGLLVRAAAAGAVLGGGLAFGSDVRLQGAGATFPNPLYQRWVTDYQKAHPDVMIDYQATGSGNGVKAITEKTVDFAGSDAPLHAKEFQSIGGEQYIVEVPSCIGADVPAYNVPGVSGDLKFTGELLCDIFMGTVSKWNDPKIAALNPGMKLPDLAITPAWRSDGSGTTYVFTSYLATQSETFKSTIGVGKQVKWPIGQGGKGNDGVAAIIQQTAGAIGYIELNYATANKIPFGQVKNKAGRFVKASTETAAAAGEAGAAGISGNILAVDLMNQGGDNTYPIASFTYLIVYKDMNNVKDQAKAQALADFLWWAAHDGQKTAPELDYAPLTSAVQAKVEGALKTLTYNGAPLKFPAR